MSDVISQLILIVSASYGGAIGYADLFDCNVISVLSGTMGEAQITLTVLPRDKEMLEFIVAHQNPKQLKIGFTQHQTNEPYALTPISGFVDASKTSWTIDFIDEAPK